MSGGGGATATHGPCSWEAGAAVPSNGWGHAESEDGPDISRLGLRWSTFVGRQTGGDADSVVNSGHFAWKAASQPDICAIVRKAMMSEGAT